MGEKKYIGIEIGGTKFQAIVADEKLNIFERVFVTVGDVKKASILQDKIKNSITKLMYNHEIESIGVGFGGPIDIISGKIFASFQVEGWNNFNLKMWLNNKFNIPVFVENDANTAALAEARIGCGENFNRVFYITLGSGVGGGFVIDGEIYHGKSLCESEFGHIRINKDGATVESCCSGWALNNKLREYIRKEPDGILSELAKDKGEDPSKFILEAIKKGDLKAKAIIYNMTDNLAFGLSHVVHLLNPDIIIVGGGLSLIGEYISVSILTMIPKYIMASIKNNLPEIKIASLKEDVVPVGAVLLARKSQKVS